MSTASFLLLLVQTVADDHAAANSLIVYNAVIAVVLLALAALFLFLEFLFVSYGLLGITALGCAVAGIVIGFDSSPAVGWALIIATPVIAAVVVAWGLQRLQNSNLVSKAAITEDAGYRHACTEMGITSGSREIDVLVEGPVASTGTPVTVRRIEGATVLVIADS